MSENGIYELLPAKNRAAIYNRCSSDKQEESLEIQVSQSLEIARSKGWIIADRYIELKSGTTTDDRSEYLRMIGDMSKDKFDIVMIKSLDRLMRNTRDWFNFLEVLVNNGLMLYTYMDNRFYERESCYLMYMFQAAMNEEFSVQLSKKLRNAHRIRRDRQSGWNFSRTPFGWSRVDKKTYRINEEEAYYIRRAIELVKQGCGFYTISLRLYGEGLKNTKGGKMEGSTLKNILRSPRLYGAVVMNRQRTEFRSKKRVINPPSEWIVVENAIPAIVSRGEWLELQALLDGRRTDREFQRRKYPLSGKIVCGLCGGSYHRFMYDVRRNGESTGEKAAYWKCISAYRNGHGIQELSCRSESLDEAKTVKLIGAEAERLFGDLCGGRNEIAENMLALVKKAMKQADGAESAGMMKKELSRQLRKKDVLFEKLTDGIISDSEFRIFNERLSRDIDGLRSQLALFRERRGSPIENEERLRQIRAALIETDLIERCKGAVTPELADKITVNGDGTISICWNRSRLTGLRGHDGISNEKELISTVPYNGRIALKNKVADQKRRILECIKDDPRASYAKIGAAIGASRNETASRLRYLFRDGLIGRDDTGALIVK